MYFCGPLPLPPPSLTLDLKEHTHPPSHLTLPFLLPCSPPLLSLTLDVLEQLLNVVEEPDASPSGQRRWLHDPHIVHTIDVCLRMSAGGRAARGTWLLPLSAPHLYRARLG